MIQNGFQYILYFHNNFKENRFKEKNGISSFIAQHTSQYGKYRRYKSSHILKETRAQL